jgi:pimeloyl-ACP methyl ester carboxylesterase
MRIFKTFAIVVAALLVAGVVTGFTVYMAAQRTVDQAQEALEPFYRTPSPLPPGKPGDIIRSEPMSVQPALQNTNVSRVLYRTELPDGTARVSGAMIFVPTGPTPSGGRKVISWAHPTVGMGDQCAPSRSSNPTQNMDWLQGMLNQGWIVTATDYAGLGTDGIEYYLVGQNEAIDTINAVRMAQRFPGANASNVYGVFGHSQGGHSALWTGEIAAKYAPELKLVGVAGAAPASELTSLVGQQWDKAVTWVIGPEIFVSYPAAYPHLQLSQIASDDAIGRYESIAQDCMLTAMLEGRYLQHTGHTAFEKNPIEDPAWAKVFEAQTPKPLPPSVPVLIVQSINDGVVLPNTIGLMQNTWCEAGSRLQVDWLGALRGSPTEPNSMTHIYEGAVGGTLATPWFMQRFEGAPAPTNCNTKPMVPAAK